MMTDREHGNYMAESDWVQSVDYTEIVDMVFPFMTVEVNEKLYMVRVIDSSSVEVSTPQGIVDDVVIYDTIIEMLDDIWWDKVGSKL